MSFTAGNGIFFKYHWEWEILFEKIGTGTSRYFVNGNGTLLWVELASSFENFARATPGNSPISNHSATRPTYVFAPWSPIRFTHVRNKCFHLCLKTNIVIYVFQDCKLFSLPFHYLYSKQNLFRRNRRKPKRYSHQLEYLPSFPPSFCSENCLHWTGYFM